MEAHEPYSNEIIGKDPHEKYVYNFLTLTPQFLGNICCASRPILTM